MQVRRLCAALAICCAVLGALFLASCSSGAQNTRDPDSSASTSEQARVDQLTALVDVNADVPPTGRQVRDLFTIEDAKAILGRDDLTMLAVLDPG